VPATPVDGSVKFRTNLFPTLLPAKVGKFTELAAVGWIKLSNIPTIIT
jgi:hypothetical protein